MRRAVLLAALAACSTDASSGKLTGDGGAPRRWPRPPPSEVRAYPPHAIRSDGVGPYLLDAPLSDRRLRVGNAEEARDPGVALAPQAAVRRLDDGGRIGGLRCGVRAQSALIPARVTTFAQPSRLSLSHVADCFASSPVAT